MKIVFIGLVNSLTLIEQQLHEKVYTEYAADTFQRALLDGFRSNSCEVDLITAPSITSYPKYSKFIQRGFYIEEKGKESISGDSLGFVNLPVIKLICKLINLSVSLLKRDLSNRPIVMYGVTSFQLLAVTIFARRNKKYLIVPDLPEFMSGSRNPIYRLLKSFDRYIINRTLIHIDGFVLLSNAMAMPMKVGNKPRVLVEGIYSQQKPIQRNEMVATKNEKVVLYTGTIEERYGLRDLFDAFTQIEGEEYRLWICGGGETDMINEYICKDRRIIYFGTLPRERVLEMQRDATLLVNPRHRNEEFTKYSFPSKTMEYMASGTPTLMCKLESIPEEYNKHLFFFEDESVAGMSNRIKELLDAPSEEMMKFGELASRFILENKNAKEQTRRILEMIENIHQ
ncbi:MAG: glycosyltransferase family 4 protein [Rikenellaceae bacterium]|nr:glycosyltransferase family 4 protein [Rikenellaceae bacterium]